MVLLAVVVGWQAWPESGHVVASTSPPASSLSPAEARQRDILRGRVDTPGDAALVHLYGQINARHFAGRLPDMPVIWEPRLAEVGALYAQAFNLQGMFGHIDGRTAILLSPDLASDPAALVRTLSHEMVHAYLYTAGDRATHHGPVFKGELARLSAEGAFTGIAATEAERRSLRAWLDAEAVRLEEESERGRHEGEEIERERARLDAAVAEFNARVRTNTADGRRAANRETGQLDERREAYNRRATEANRRAEQNRADVAEFNRQADRYNLMLSYPDGFDEVDLVPAPTGSPRSQG